jgi:hypothetical protein
VTGSTSCLDRVGLTRGARRNVARLGAGVDRFPGVTQERRDAKALKMDGLGAHGIGSTALAEEGVATKDESETADGRDALPMLPTSRDRLSDMAAMFCCGANTEKEGGRHAVAGVDMQRVGGIGRLCVSRSFGGRRARGGGDGGGLRIGSFGEGAPAAPDGMPAAQATMPAVPPIHRDGETAAISW